MIGGVPRHMLPHLPGVPLLHVNGPLVAFQEAQQACVFSLTTILNSIFLKPFGTPSDVILYAILKLTKNFSLWQANIYAPNEDDPSFVKQIFDHLVHDFACEEIILGGDL